MTHMRYWALTLATAVLAAFLVIDRFAFAAGTAAWIVFGVAIAATILSLAAFATALVRENHTFSGLSAVCALVAGWTVIASVVFAHPTVGWLAFAGGLVLLVLALRALALHETTVERVVHALEAGSGSAGAGVAGAVAHGSGRRVVVSDQMRSWGYWLAHTALAVAGAFVVLMTFALTTGAHSASPRGLALGIGIATTAVALAALAERVWMRATSSLEDDSGLLGAIVLTACSALTSIALIVTMILTSGGTARWVAFGLGCGLAGFSLLATALHELTSERVRHELEVAAPSSGEIRAARTGIAA